MKRRVLYIIIIILYFYTYIEDKPADGSHVCWPLHTTRNMHPLDLSFMQSFKTYCAQEVQSWLRMKVPRVLTPSDRWLAPYILRQLQLQTVPEYRLVHLQEARLRWLPTRIPKPTLRCRTLTRSGRLQRLARIPNPEENSSQLVVSSGISPRSRIR